MGCDRDRVYLFQGRVGNGIHIESLYPCQDCSASIFNHQSDSFSLVSLLSRLPSPSPPLLLPRLFRNSSPSSSSVQRHLLTNIFFILTHQALNLNSSLFLLPITPHLPPTPMAEDSQHGSGQSTSSHMMKTTKRGRPFLKVYLPLQFPLLPRYLLWCLSALFRR